LKGGNQSAKKRRRVGDKRGEKGTPLEFPDGGVTAKDGIVTSLREIEERRK